MKTSFTRRLSLADLTYAASGYRIHHSNQLLCQLIIKGVGKIPEHKLLDACAEVARYCPIVRSRLKGLWIAKYWSASGPLPRVRTINQDWDGQTHEGVDFLDAPLDLITGPVAEIVQVVGRNTYIVFRVHHAVTDGVGMLEFAQSFFKVMNRDKPDYYTSPITLEKMPHGNLEAIPPRVTDAAVPYKLKEVKDGEVDRGRTWRRLTIPGNDKKILLKTMLAIAVLARGKTDLPVRIHMPVSLRRYVPQERTLANLFGMLRIDVEASDHERELIKKIKKAMADRQKLPIAVNSVTSKVAFVFPLFLLHLVEKIAMKKLLSQPKFRCSATTSHGGTLKLSDISTEYFSARSACGVPVSPLGTPLMVVSMSNENCTEVVITANNTLISEIDMDDLADKLRHLIDGYTARSRVFKSDLPVAASA